MRVSMSAGFLLSIPRHTATERKRGDADFTSWSIWTCTFAQLRASSCRVRYAFMHMHSNILATGLEQLE